jgi:hypothetical protein
MTEDSPHIAESDFSRMSTGIVAVLCKKCNRITKQKYLGLEFSSRKVASRCLECSTTNFQEEDPDRWRNRKKKDAELSLKEIEDEKSKIFGSSAESAAADDPEALSNE